MGMPPAKTQPLERLLAYRDLVAASLTDDLFYAVRSSCYVSPAALLARRTA